MHQITQERPAFDGYASFGQSDDRTEGGVARVARGRGATDVRIETVDDLTVAVTVVFTDVDCAVRFHGALSGTNRTPVFDIGGDWMCTVYCDW